MLPGQCSESDHSSREARIGSGKCSDRRHDTINISNASGLYRIKQSRVTGRPVEAEEGMEVFQRGLEGLSDLRMELSPEAVNNRTH